MNTVDFSETIAASDLKVGRCRQLIEIMKVPYVSIEVQGHFLTIYFPGFVCTRPRYQVSVYRTIGPLVCICENKDADQLRGNSEADQRLCFRQTDRTIPLLPKSEISSIYPSSVAVQPGLCWTGSETRTLVFS